jgi:hypothetical protein
MDANNDVLNGISYVASEMRKGNFLICADCPILIGEIQAYVWDQRKAKLGIDAPLKESDHSVDSIRYSLFSHKITAYQPYNHSPNTYLNSRFGRSNF